MSLGEEIDFAYDISASFSSADQAGFDAVRIRTGAQATFKKLYIGDDEIAPTVVPTTNDGLTIILPQHITKANNAPLRIVFSAEVFELATTFLGEVSYSQTETLPQPIVDGDASDALSTNSLRVLSTSDQQPALLQNLSFSTPVLTPNGDQVHDELRIDYQLFGLPEEVAVALEIYTLDGSRINTVPQGLQTAGPQTAHWDGRDQNGAVLPPGIYLIAVAIQSERSADTVLRPLGLAY